MTTTEFERPTELTETDVTLVTRGITIQAAVVLSNALALVVRPLAEASARGVGVKDGDPVELFWNNGFEERMLPAQVSGVDGGGALRWTLTATDEATKSTRRRACAPTSSSRCGSG